MTLYTVDKILDRLSISEIQTAVQLGYTIRKFKIDSRNIKRQLNKIWSEDPKTFGKYVQIRGKDDVISLVLVDKPYMRGTLAGRKYSYSDKILAKSFLDIVLLSLANIYWTDERVNGSYVDVDVDLSKGVHMKVNRQPIYTTDSLYNMCSILRSIGLEESATLFIGNHRSTIRNYYRDSIRGIR